jgi:hypothetical protein
MKKKMDKDFFVPVRCKDGKTRIAHPHIVTFKGKHNASKSKILLICYHQKFMEHSTIGFSARQLATASGVSYGYLKKRLPKWVEWQYLLRKATAGPQGKPLFIYSIASRGSHFLEDRAPKEKLDQCLREIRAAKTQSAGRQN